ncbi:MAG: M48 family metalloprotease [Alphaproteobacteria bacterium]
MIRADKPRRRLVAAALIATTIAMAGCAINPASGRQQLSLLSPQDEVAIGAREFPKLVDEFGGVYDDPRLAAYVDRVGQSVAAVTGPPGTAYSFTVLDSDLPNAFALPGGYVAVTRGLLALVNDEAELAGVLAHEVAHVTARHTAERYSRSTLAQLGVGVLGAATGSSELAELAGTGAQIYLLGYSRDQESEADAIGIRYLAAAGYDAYAMASFLDQLDRYGQVTALMEGQPADGGRPDFLSTHPQTADRTRQAMALARRSAGPQSIRDRDGYLATIDGLVWGEGGANGFIRGQIFASPVDGFVWQAPPGFTLRHSGGRVLATGDGDARMLFDTVSSDPQLPIGPYLTDVWARNISLESLESLEIRRYPAATAVTRLPTGDGVRDIRIFAIKPAPDRVSRFMFVTRPDQTERLAPQFQRAAYSFRPMTPAERSAYRPRRIDVIPVAVGETVASLARRMPFDSHAEERFRALNGLDPGAPLRPGQWVKLIVD